MPDLSMFGVFLLAVCGCLLYGLLRPRRARELMCPECRIPLEHDADAPAAEVLGRSIALLSTAQFAEPHTSYYHCPQCGHRTRVTY